MDTATAALIGAGLATCGWLYAARRARTLSRKQHTVNVMLQASLNKDFRDALLAIARERKNGACPDLSQPGNETLALAMKFVTNHYEFVAAGVRNGDFDERLMKDSERGIIIRVFQFFEAHIYSERKSRDLLPMYENLEWLNIRWTKKVPGRLQVVFEWVRQQPIGGKRVNPHA